jgi:CheY-like chemotaxis protein
VESYGGSISVGRSGAVVAGFTALLPVDDGATAEQPEESETVTTRRILIVDDDDEIGALLEDTISGDGYSIERATSGREAVEKLAEGAFDLILTDLIMPDMGGRELFREVRIRYPHMLSRVIVVTGDTRGHEARSFLEDAGCPVIEKPFVAADVRRVVAERLAQD